LATVKQVESRPVKKILASIWANDFQTSPAGFRANEIPTLARSHVRFQCHQVQRVADRRFPVPVVQSHSFQVGAKGFNLIADTGKFFFIPFPDERGIKN
jgi:hypothetical protein